jgi:hypothetical protein
MEASLFGLALDGPIGKDSICFDYDRANTGHRQATDSKLETQTLKNWLYVCAATENDCHRVAQLGSKLVVDNF